MKMDEDNPRSAHARYLRIPSWVSLRCRALASRDPDASNVSIELGKHRPIPVQDSMTPDTMRGHSADGLLFDGAESLEPGTVVELEIVFQPDDVPVRLRGEVVDAKACDTERDRYHIRVGFIAGTEDEVDVIAQFVKKFYS